MPYCPQCGHEYLPSARECPDCRVPLVAHLPAEADRQPVKDPLVPVYEAPSEVMSLMVRAVLEEAGIPVIAQSGLMPWYDDVRSTLRGYHSRLLVFKSHGAEARRVITAYLAEVETGAAQAQVDEEDEGDGGD